MTDRLVMRVVRVPVPIHPRALARARRAMAERDAALELLTPTARARIERAEAEVERRLIGGDAPAPEGRSDD